MIRQIKFVSIPFENQDRALAFYTEKLGFTILTDQQYDATQRWIELQIPGADTGVVLFRTNEGLKPGGVMNLSFATDDLQATYEEYRARGVEFVQPPTAQAWGMFAMFLDSEGNRFVLSGRR